MRRCCTRLLIRSSRLSVRLHPQPVWPGLACVCGGPLTITRLPAGLSTRQPRWDFMVYFSSSTQALTPPETAESESPRSGQDTWSGGARPIRQSAAMAEPQDCLRRATVPSQQLDGG